MMIADEKSLCDGESGRVVDRSFAGGVGWGEVVTWLIFWGGEVVISAL